MVANKYLIPDDSTLLKGKLDKLSKNLQTSLSASSFQTQEEYLFEATRVLREFSKELTEPQMKKAEVLEDNLPKHTDYDDMWNRLLDDLTIIFTELENVETLVVSNFNYITTEANRLTSRLKSVSSKLGDYILYSLNPTKDAIYFIDSFNDLTKLELNSALLNEEECDISQEEGVTTLPIDKSKDSILSITETPIINPDSNGVVGNNQQTGAVFNGDIRVLLDNNPDTWFEYERVVTGASDQREPLVLDFTVNLGEKTVINHIRVNPNNFGTKTAIQVEDISTSLDGEAYTSIKDDVPIAGFTTEDEENVFVLAPSSSKFAGQGLYTFTPRKVKYVRFILKQPEPYVIQTTTEERSRYAIGIRDVDIRAFSYKPKGEIVSTRYQSLDEIRKVILQSNQNPSEYSELASITFMLSPDDGGTWHRIQPKEFTGVAGIVGVPEILDFNSADTASITTAVPVKSLRLKVAFERNDDAFEEGSSSFSKTIDTRSELHEIPSSSPFSFSLEKPPVNGTVAVVEPLFGSCGLPGFPYVLGNTSADGFFYSYKLPFPLGNRPWQKEDNGEYFELKPVDIADWIHVLVGGEEWTHSDRPLNLFQADWATSTPAKLFVIDPVNQTLAFGNNQTTFAPADNTPISLWLEADRITPGEVEDNHIASLTFATASNKTDMTIKRYDKEEESLELLGRGKTIARLRHQGVTSASGIAETLGYDEQQTFVNGWEELTATDEWSVDELNGVVYMYTPTSTIVDTSVSYTWQNIYALSTDEWDWATDKVLRDSVSIKESAWKAITVDETTIPFLTSSTVLDLEHLSIVKGTLNLLVIDSNPPVDDESTEEDEAQSANPFITEVLYEDGSTELGALGLKQTLQQVPSLTNSSLNVISLIEQLISTDTSAHKIVFSNKILFATEVAWGTPSVGGEYAIQRDSNHSSYGQCQVYVDAPGSLWEAVYVPNTSLYGGGGSWTLDGTTIVRTGTITYFYEQLILGDEGKYSVDYENGRIFTDRPLLSTFTILASYHYVDFRAEYQIARLLDPLDYDVDITNRTVVVKDSEVFRHLSLPKSSLKGRNGYYLVNYDYVSSTRENITDLKEFFSPVLKDYALKVLTKGRIF